MPSERPPNRRASPGGATNDRNRQDVRKKSDERTRSWGSVARRGAKQLKEPNSDYIDKVPGRPDRYVDSWTDEGRVDGDEKESKSVRPARRSQKGELPSEVIDEVTKVVGSEFAKRVITRLSEATHAFQRERWDDARSTLSPLVKQYPDVIAIRELYGLVLYRMGRWKEAIKQFEAFGELSGTYDQYPVLADCFRALGRHGDVERLWDQLRQAGVGVEILTEGRIVTAGSMADNGKIKEAIRLLEEGPVSVKKPREHHLRLWYALASTYESAGDIPRARAMFKQLRAIAPGFADVDQRLANLS